MAKIRFLNEGDIPNKQNYHPTSLLIKRKLLFFKILSGIETCILLFILYKKMKG